MFETIIFGTDGSQAADLALPIVRRLGAQGGRVVVVHANEIVVGRGGAWPRYPDEDFLRAKVEQQVRELEGEGVDVRLHLVTGVGTDAAHALGDVARQEGADLIVVGTRGHSRVAALLVGSVTQRLLHVAPCPVLAVPPAREVSAPASDEAAGAAADARSAT